MNNNIRIWRLVTVLLVLAATASALSGCKKEIKPKNRIFYEYFDTVSTIYDYSGGTDADFKANVTLFEERLEYYHRLFDIYNEYDGINNLATVNRLASSGDVKVDEALIEFLEYAVEIHKLTDGNTNIAMGSVLSIWHKYREAGEAIPTESELRAAAEHTDIKKLVIDRENLTVRFLDSGMLLDVGAIAKGYAVERIAEELIARGVSAYVLDVGGNLRAIGSKVDGGTWRTGVQNPDFTAKERYVYYLNIKDTSVVTSGDYQRYYTVDGVKYHHIINKDTLMPAGYFSSVTIVTKDSGLADALSTALFNMDYESGLQLVSSLDNVSVIWVTKDGEVKKYGI